MERIIGSGGMGIVYCARHVHLDRVVALKLLAPELAGTAEARRRFIRESRIAASINHPNIVTVYDAGEIHGQLYIAMQYIDGSDLRTVCQTEHILAPERVLWMLEQVASALDAAHDHGLVHRDVKPGNVLVDDQKAYLTDFGLTKTRRVSSRDSGSVTQEGHFIGTVNYSAPEQITGRDIDYRADIYSLGAVVYECLVGDVPYPRPDSMTTALAHMSDPIPQVTTRRPDLPRAIDGVIEKALSKDKNDRYPSCGELYAGVESALEGAPSAVPRAPRRRRARRKPDARTAPEGAGRDGPRRGRWPLIAVGGAVAALAVAIALLLSGGSEPRPSQVAHGPRAAASKPKPAFTVTSAHVGRRPFGVAYGSGGVWVTSFDQDAIRRVDPATGQVTGERILVGDGPFALTVARGFVWVANNHADSVARVDVTTSTLRGAPAHVCDAPSGMQAAAGFIWVACANDDTVARVNPVNGQVVGRTHVGDLPRGITATPGVIWVTARRDASVTRIDSANGKVIGAPIHVGHDPHYMTVANGMVWVTDNDDDTVTRIAVKSARVVGRPIHVGHAPWGIAYGLGAVWVANSASDTVTRIDATTGRVMGPPIHVGRQPSGITTGGGSVWVTENNEGSIARIRSAKKTT